ncbi:hypothetical protein [Paenarthrobacter sp. NPDC058040]|uniref:hypothetical protein n=1 Tax=unclassified Paenarthrobacter TaxID=2634190 RepID=UPI0036DC6F3C
MILESGVSAVRHYVENLLAAFALALTLHDTDALERLLKGVSLGFHHADCTLTPRELMSQTVESGVSFVTISNVNVLRSGKSAAYHCFYQVWGQSVGRTCHGMGTLKGLLRAGPQVWRWTEHTVAPFPSPEQVLSTPGSLGSAT